ncbi:TadE/TadG family type IV pilus assembly protein [Aestuariibius sp. HNIBRBA575]|uniref:TadE/TadG family type IV pilus assembly protein n=1 Tax=Aestuariibius sp. HNIBRBA575 TaxID=3233343 RepID=UPI0034A18D2D
MMFARPTLSWLRKFRRDEDGNSTIEFVLVVPFIMTIFLCSFEMGLMMIRNVMLERGVDLAVRSVRLGTTNQVNADQLRDMVCNGAGIIPDCQSAVKIEMVRIDTAAWVDIPRDADCVDRNDPAAPARSFTTGGMNELMVLRVCALFDPIFPTTGLGFRMPKESNGAYAIVTTSAFVMEPG